MAKLHHAECMAQKARKKAKAKVKEEAKRRRVAEEEKKKKRMLEYLQQLWNKVLEEEATLLEDAEEFHIVGSKCKEITSGDEERHQPSKKAKEKQLGKYYRSTTVKMGDANLCERCVSTEQDCLVHHSR